MRAKFALGQTAEIERKRAAPDSTAPFIIVDLIPKNQSIIGNSLSRLALASP
tara:strand:- start:3 stop:158 length:156 start_codon:yes stop_codon:yes gene_type:complete